MNAVYCRDTCATAGFNCEKETFVRLWDNVTQWNELSLRKPKGSAANAWATGVPGTTDDVLIPCEWSVKLNVDSLTVNSLTLDGTLRFDESRAQTTLSASYIWARGGKLAAGLLAQPFPNKINIILTGGLLADNVVIDPFANVGNKVLAVTGRVELFGIAPGTKFTRLTANAAVGATVITVAAATDWIVGDELVIGPTNELANEAEKVTITAITGTSVTVTPAL